MTATIPPAYRGAEARTTKGVVAGVASANLPEEAVLFMIGMRVNRVRRPDRWVPIAMAMGTMLRELLTQDDSPLLGARSWLSGRDIMTVQHWRSAEELGRFATDPEHFHATAWRDFNRKVAATADVGIWHETYVVGPDQVETLYGNMPAFGLGAAHGLVPVGARRRTAATRRVHEAAGGLEVGRDA